MRPQYYVVRMVSVLIVTLVLSGLFLANNLAYAQLKNPQYEGVTYTILTSKITTPSGTHNKPFSNAIYAKPYLYNKMNVFDVKFKIRPSWDGNALAAVYVPAALDIWKDTNPQYQGEIISKRPTNIGLIAVFRGSPYHYGTLPNGGTYSIKYVLHNGTLHLHVAIRWKVYTYTVKILMKKFSEQEAIVEAWIKARAGISGKLKFLNFFNAGFSLASIEAGVKAKIINKVKVEKGYEVTVSFSIPIYEYAITYSAKIYIEEDYNAKGNGIVPTSKSLTGSNVVSRVYHYNLAANGVYTGYSDYKELTAFSSDKQFDGGGTTGTLVFIKA